MASVAVVAIKELEGAARLDAQLYQEDARAARSLIANLPVGSQPLGRVTSSFRKGIFYVPQEAFSVEGVPYVRIGSLKNGLVEPTETLHIDPEFAERHTATQLTVGDLVLSKTAYPAAALITLARCNVSQDIIAAKIAPTWLKRLAPGYVAAFLNTSEGLALMRQWFQGNVQMHLSLPDARRVPIPLFSEALQKPVHECWMQADASMRDAYRIFADAVAILQTKCPLPPTTETPHFVVDSSVVRHHARLDAEHYRPYYAALRDSIRTFEGGSVSLLDVASLSAETVEPRGNPSATFQYVELNDVNSGVGLCEGAETITGAEAPTRARMVLRSGWIIASSVAGSLERVAMVDDSLNGAVGSTGFFVFKPRDVAPEYLLALTSSKLVRHQLMCEAGGTILASVPAPLLTRVEVPLFDDPIRDEVTRLVQTAHSARRRSMALLRGAVRAVSLSVNSTEAEGIAVVNGVIGQLDDAYPAANQPRSKPT